MGSFAYSLHVKTDDHAAVIRAVSDELAEFGYVTTDEAPSPDAVLAQEYGLRAVRVSEAKHGWVSVLDSDLIETMSLAVALSARLQTYALNVLVNDSDSWHYQLFHEGSKVDEFSSTDDSDDLEGLDEQFWDDEEMQDAFDQQFQQLPEAAKSQINDLAEQIHAMMPPEILAIQDRMERGEVDPAEALRYTEWFQSQLPQLMSGLGAALSAGFTGASPADNGNGQGVDDDDQDFGFLDDDGDDAEDPLSAALDGGDAEQLEAHDPEELAAHAELLAALFRSGVDRQRVCDVLGREDVFAEQTLAAFLPLLGIEPFYATLNYGYFEECSDADLTAAGVSMAEHLKFAPGKAAP